MEKTMMQQMEMMLPMSSMVMDDLFRKDSEYLLKRFKQGWTYPMRPLPVNTKLPYKLLMVKHPNSFVVEIHDATTADFRKNVEEECAVLERLLYDLHSSTVQPLQMQFLEPMMPVIVKNSTERKIERAEVNEVDLHANFVNVSFVDSGKTRWIPAYDLYAPSTELLRYPQLAMPCRLTHVVPYGKAPRWPEYDYASLFKGKKTSFLKVTTVVQGILEVHLECDNIDVGCDMVMNKMLADLCPLQYLAKDEKTIGAYPRYDFSDWIGQKICVFGTKFAAVGKTMTVYLQLDTGLANKIWDMIEALPAVLPPNNRKKIGDPVLVIHENERYRATITKESLRGFLVQLVDYGDFVNVEQKNVFQIPDVLIKLPEAATPCLIAELLNKEHPPTEEMKNKLKVIIPDQNLNCVIGHVDFFDPQEETQGAKWKCLVSISQPMGDVDIPLSKILGVPPVKMVYTFKHKQEIISQTLCASLLSGQSHYFQDRMYTAILSFLTDATSVWLHLEGDDVRADQLTEEITEFYQNWLTCPPMDPKKLVSGAYIVAQYQDDGKWYRAVVRESQGDDKYKVDFMDYGNAEIVTINMIKPLIKYFAKTKFFAVQVALPIDCSNVDPDAVYDFIYEFMANKTLSVYMRNQNLYNFAWMMADGISMVHSMVTSGYGRMNMQPPPNFPVF